TLAGSAAAGTSGGGAGRGAAGGEAPGCGAFGGAGGAFRRTDWSAWGGRDFKGSNTPVPCRAAASQGLVPLALRNSFGLVAGGVWRGAAGAEAPGCGAFGASEATFRRTDWSAWREMHFKVSNTPIPCSAAASKCWVPLAFSTSLSLSTGWMFRMSRLLYWKI